MSCQLSALHSGVSVQDLNCKIPPSVKTLMSLLLPLGSFFVLEAGKHRVCRPVGCSPTWHHGKRLVTSLLGEKDISFSCLPLCCAWEAQSNKMENIISWRSPEMMKKSWRVFKNQPAVTPSQYTLIINSFHRTSETRDLFNKNSGGKMESMTTLKVISKKLSL